jgi:hypothetical protein
MAHPLDHLPRHSDGQADILDRVAATVLCQQSLDAFGFLPRGEPAVLVVGVVRRLV